MAPGELVTVPEPEPAFVTVSMRFANVAVTALLALIVRVQVPVPVQSPLQPVNVEPVAGVAVSVTLVPSSYPFEHVAPQLIVPGELVTVPDPVPAFVTVRVRWITNVAVAALFALIVSVHVPVPLQSPLQPLNLEPEAGVAVSVTLVPSPYESEQVAPQLIAPGELVTVPEPAPAFVTVKVRAVPLIVNVFAELNPMLPEESDCCACAVYVPGASGVVPSTVQAPPDCVVLRVCVGEPVTALPA
jgi:hypothetical protein